MKIAVIGTGNIGRTVGGKLAAAGHEVTFGSRSPDGDRAGGELAAPVASVADALAGAEAVVVAIPAAAVQGFAEEHAPALAGTLVIDAANRVGGPGPAHSHEVLAAAVPSLRYARAFNSLGWENLRDPVVESTQADMFFSAADADRSAVAGLIEAVGLRPVHVGDGSEDLVDGVLRLWLALSRRHGRHLAFRMLADSDPA